MHSIKHRVFLSSVSLILLGCTSFPDNKNQKIQTTRIECDILAREKSLFDAIQLGDKQAYIEHLTDKQYTNRQDEETLDETISRLHHKADSLSVNADNPHRSELRRYYGTIKLNHQKTVAYVNHGFRIASCLGCRAIRFGDITTMKSVWRLEKDGHWRRQSNKAGRSISIYRFKYNEAQCLSSKNQD